jgi:hypothetical protein
MKSNAALRAVENNSFNSKDFTIQASGKMFHMVISGLYSNKPESITREIWSNAFDAHAMIGKQDTPFEVTFPTALTPTFTCRDFGDGIAHDDMEGFYTVLGHSNKENTNKAVGKWGVGRMSPMSYTDTFSVVSRHKGMITYYSVQLGPDGSPQLHVLAPPMPTTEPSGLEISFPVKRSDIRDFQVAADRVAIGFDVKPVVTNSQQDGSKTFAHIKKTFEGNGYYLHNDSRLSGVYAQMGCVLYPIPWEHTGQRRVGVVYKFDIGELEVTASREALSFGPNDPTLDSLKTKFKEVEGNIAKDFQAEIDTQPTLFFASRLASKLSLHLRSNVGLSWKGKALDFSVWAIDDAKELAVCCSYLQAKEKSASFSSGSYASDNLRFNLLEDQVIYVQDVSEKKLNARAARRIAASLRAEGKKNYIWVKAYLKDKEQVKHLQNLIDTFDFPVYHVKDLPDEGAIKSGPRGKITLNTLEGGELTPWDMDDATFAAGGFYTITSNREYPHLIRLAEKYIKSAMGISRIIMVPKTLSKKFEDALNWQVLEPVLEKSLRDVADGVRKVLCNRYNHWEFTLFGKYAGKFGGEAGDFALKVKTYEQPNPYDTHYGRWQDIFNKLNLPVSNDRESMGNYQNVLSKYPLLNLLTDKYSEEFIRYVRLVNEATEKTQTNHTQE